MYSTTNNITTKLGIPLEGDIDFRSLIYSLWENKLIIGITTLFIVLISMTYTIWKTPNYESNALIQVENKKSNPLSLAPMGVNASTIDLSAVQSELIKTRFILEPVIRNLGLDIQVTPHYFPVIGRKHTNDLVIIKQLTLPSIYYGKKLKLMFDSKNFYQLRDSKDQLLITGKIGKVSKNNAEGIEILISDLKSNPNAKFDVTRYSTSELIDSFASKLRIDELGHGIGSKTGILQITLMDPNKEKLITILNEIVKVVEKKDVERKLIETSNTLEVLEKNLPKIKASLDKAENDLNRYRANSGKLDIKLESQSAMVQLQGINKQITEATLTKIALLQNYTEKHPFVLEINEKISQLEKQKYILQDQIKKLPALDQAIVSLMRDVTVKTTLYLELLNKIEELRVNKASMSGDIRILSWASIPDVPISKKIPVVFIASTLVGLILGTLMILVRKSFLRVIDDPSWIERHFNIPNCAIIPYSKNQTNTIHAYKTNRSKQINILAEKYPNDLSIEALRSLRTSFQIIQAGSHNNVVSITGCSPSIGKSFISVNFAFLLADIGKRILLIDGDIRKGYMHDYFKIPRSPGLTEFLIGTHPLEKVINKIATSTLHFMPSGSLPLNPSELLTGQNFKDLVNLLSQQYDLVLIDTPPVLAVTDGAIIGAVAGTNLLVVGSAKHQAEEITLTIKRLENAGVKIHGTIFNYLNQGHKSTLGNYQYNYTEEVQP